MAVLQGNIFTELYNYSLKILDRLCRVDWWLVC